MQKTMKLERLPRSARQELFDFYDFLVQKYAPTPKRNAKSTVAEAVRRQRLQRIFDESQGKLPDGYRFDRNEAHDR